MKVMVDTQSMTARGLGLLDTAHTCVALELLWVGGALRVLALQAGVPQLGSSTPRRSSAYGHRALGKVDDDLCRWPSLG